MENSAAASDEPQKKRPHLNSVFSSPTMARHSKTSSDNKAVRLVSLIPSICPLFYVYCFVVIEVNFLYLGVLGFYS